MRQHALLRSDKDRKSTRLNSSHDQISYAVFCLKKKKENTDLIFSLNSVTRKEMGKNTGCGTTNTTPRDPTETANDAVTTADARHRVLEIRASRLTVVNRRSHSLDAAQRRADCAW